MLLPYRVQFPLLLGHADGRHQDWLVQTLGKSVKNLVNRSALPRNLFRKHMRKEVRTLLGVWLDMSAFGAWCIMCFGHIWLWLDTRCDV